MLGAWSDSPAICDGAHPTAGWPGDHHRCTDSFRDPLGTGRLRSRWPDLPHAADPVRRGYGAGGRRHRIPRAPRPRARRDTGRHHCRRAERANGAGGRRRHHHHTDRQPRRAGAPGAGPWPARGAGQAVRAHRGRRPGTRRPRRTGRLVITPYQNRRWDSDFLTIRRLLADGSLGAVHRFTSRIDRFKPVKGSWHGGTVEQGGGTLLDLGPHLVDQALHLFGPAEWVHAGLATVREGAGAEDDIELHLRHAGGVRSTLAAGMASAAPGPRFQVNGSAAGYLIDGFDVQEEQLKNGGSPAGIGPGWGVEPESAWGRLFDGQRELLMPSERGRWDTFYPAVARAVAGLGAPPVDPRDAVTTARVLVLS